MIFENSTVVFTINLVGDKSGQTYIGTFKAKCIMSPLDVINSDRLFRDLLGPTAIYEASIQAKNMAFALSQTKYRLIEVPEWWSVGEVGGSDIFDYNVIMEVLDECLKAEEGYSKNRIKTMEEQKKKLSEAIKQGKIKKKQKPEDQPLEE